ncbi:glycoside hydrolase family 79 protein [Lyophyllum atratum]|nr:glycoside hydrolase family 79 protein [Lyophyllum atratum]
MILALFLFVALLGHRVFGVNVAIPLVPPSTAATVSPSLFSFSIEQDRWTDWAGSTSRNQFFFNTLDNLGRLTGTPPQIRVGADSEDHTKFNAAIKTTQLVFPAISKTVPYPEATNITVGDAFYQATQFLPPNTHVIWGLNFGQNNLTTAFLEARSIVKAFASPAITGANIVLDAIEIGNEADLYRNNGARPSSYSITQYVKEWTSFATNITSAAGISATSHTKFWGAAFAGSSHSTSGFSPQSAFNSGLTKSTAGSLIATISQHHYSGSFCAGSGGLLQDLMTKSTIRSNLTSFKPDITATRALGLDYVFGETNSYSCHGAPGVSNSAGAALWGLDYALFATQIGISRVFFHQGVGYKYNHIQPVTLTRSILDGSNLPSPLPPHVQPTYYGAIIAAEAIGKSGSTRAVELTIANTRIAGYAFFEGTKLVRAVFINSNAFLQGATTRASVHLDLSFTGTGTAPTKISVKRLKIGHADDQSGLTWGGQSYETSDGRPSGSVVVQTGSVSAGVDITATEAVLVSFS